MGRWIHRKPEPSHVRGLCIICNSNRQKPVAGRSDKFRAICNQCDKKQYCKTKPERQTVLNYRAFKKTICERCGFVPEHLCQLDVDHIDTNHDNNDPSNLQTLCANCHRLKTWKERQPSPA